MLELLTALSSSRRCSFCSSQEEATGLLHPLHGVLERNQRRKGLRRGALVVQWLRLCTSTARAWVQSLISELRSCITCCCCYLVSELCPTLQPHGLQSARLLCPWGFPGKNTGVGCHFLLQGIFPTQGSNPRLLHRQKDSLPTKPPEMPSF